MKLVDGFLTNHRSDILGGDNKAAVAVRARGGPPHRDRRAPPRRHRGRAHAVRGDRPAGRRPPRPGVARVEHGVRVRPHRTDRRHRLRRPVAAQDRRHVRGAHRPRRHRAGAGPLRDRGGHPRHLPHAPRPDRRGHHRERRHDRRRHRHQRRRRALLHHRRGPQPRRARPLPAGHGHARRPHLGRHRGGGRPGVARRQRVQRLPVDRPRRPGQARPRGPRGVRLPAVDGRDGRRFRHQRLPRQRARVGEPVQRDGRRAHRRRAHRRRPASSAPSTSRSRSSQRRTPGSSVAAAPVVRRLAHPRGRRGGSSRRGRPATPARAVRNTILAAGDESSPPGSASSASATSAARPPPRP